MDNGRAGHPGARVVQHAIMVHGLDTGSAQILLLPRVVNSAQEIIHRMVFVIFDPVQVC